MPLQGRGLYLFSKVKKSVLKTSLLNGAYFWLQIFWFMVFNLKVPWLLFFANNYGHFGNIFVVLSLILFCRCFGSKLIFKPIIPSIHKPLVVFLLFMLCYPLGTDSELSYTLISNSTCSTRPSRESKHILVHHPKPVKVAAINGKPRVVQRYLSRECKSCFSLLLYFA